MDPIPNEWFVFLIALGTVAMGIVKNTGWLITIGAVIVLLVFTQERNNDRIQAEKQAIVDSLDSIVRERTNYIADYLPCKDRYPFFNLLVQAGKPGQQDQVVFVVHNRFELPLFDVEAQLFDYNLIEKKKFINPATGKATISEADDRQTLILQTEHSFIGGLQYKGSIGHNFFSTDAKLVGMLYSRGKTVRQKIVFVRINDKVKMGFRVVEPISGKVLIDSIYGAFTPGIKDSITKELDKIPDYQNYKIGL
jgi:hypothetical protein